MADETATSRFEADISDILSELNKLEEELNNIEGRFEGVGANASAQLNQASSAAGTAAGGMQRLGAAAGPLRSMAGIFTGIAGSVRLLVSAFGAVAPYINGLPDSIHSKWIPALKQMFAHVGVTNAALQAMSGRLTLAGAAFAFMDARAIGASRALAGFGAMGALVASKTVSAFRSVGSMIGNVTSGLISMGTSLGPALAPLAAAGVAAAVFAGGLALIGAGVSRASQMQDFETSFTTLLGSVDAAEARISELSDFAAKTPFELPDVIKASRTLETLTKGVLSTGEGLRMVGDAAAITGQPISELSTWFGRLYDGIQSGRPVGEALMRLQELGLVSGDVRTKIEQMQKSGAKGGDVWQVAAAQFGKYSGEMERRSKTFSGQMSNLKDEIGRLMTEFGKPIMEALTPLLAALVANIGELKPIMAALGQIIAEIIKGIGWILGVKPQEKQREVQKLTPEDQVQQSATATRKVSKDRELALGGSFFSQRDPLIDESRRQTGYLARIAARLEKGDRLGTSLDRTPVPAVAL